MKKPKDPKKRGHTDDCKEFWVKKKKPKHLKDNFLFVTESEYSMALSIKTDGNGYFEFF